MKLKYYIRTLGLGIFVTALLMGLATTPKTKEIGNTDGSDLESSANRVLTDTVLSMEESTEGKENSRTTEELFANESESEAQSDVKSENESEAQSDVKSESESEAQSDVKSESESEAQLGMKPESEPESETESTPESIPESESTDEEVNSSQAADGFVELEIRRGDSSDKVSHKLQELGLIEDAKSFDRYLCNNGYDKRISVGNYLIPTGSGEEEIALIISGKKK